MSPSVWCLFGAHADVPAPATASSSEPAKRRTSGTASRPSVSMCFTIAEPTAAEAKRVADWEAVKQGWTAAQVDEALPPPSFTVTKRDFTTLGFKLRQLTFEVTLEEGKVIQTSIRDWEPQ